MKITQNLNQRMSIAVQFHQKGQFEHAENLYMGILSDYPNHPDILNLLSVACSQQGKNDKAINYMKMAIIFNPNNPEYYCNLGETLHRVNNLPEAAENLQKAIKLAPNFAMAHFNLANVLKKLNETDQSISHYQQAISFMPGNPEFYYNLGNTYRDLGLFRTAIETYQQALKINNNLPDVHNNLAATLVEWDDTEKALLHYQQAIKLKPDFIDAYLNLSGIYQKLGQTEKAVESLDKAQLLNKNNDKNDLFELAKESIFPVISKNNEEIDSYREKLNNVLNKINVDNFSFDDLKKFECYPPSMMTYQGKDNKVIKEKYYELYKAKFTAFAKRPVNKIPHIGFVVTHGHEGVFIKCMAGIINNISKEKFKITIVCSYPNGEKILRPVIQSDKVNYLTIPHELDKAAQIIYENNFDILHYWEIGTDSINYFLPYFNTANIQCTSWGWPDTSGIKNIDYYLTCENFETTESMNHYSEKLVKLNNLPVYYYMPPVPETLKSRQHFKLDENINIYLCAQNLRKVHPDFDEIIFKILEKDTKAKILFISDKQKNITDTLKDRLLSQRPEFANQIRFMERMEESEYLSLVKISDVILDTTYYTGGANTNYDAFACGTPVVTLPTTHHRGKYTTGVYEKMGIFDCITKDSDDYSEIALKIANDKNYRNKLSARILEKSKILFEDIKAVHELEDCFMNLLGKDIPLTPFEGVKNIPLAPFKGGIGSNDNLVDNHKVEFSGLVKNDNLLGNQSFGNSNSFKIPDNQVFSTVIDSGADLFVYNQQNTTKQFSNSNFDLQSSIVTVPEIVFDNSVDISNKPHIPVITDSGLNNNYQKKEFITKIPDDVLKTKKYPSLAKILNKKIVVDIVDIGAANVDQRHIYQDLIDSGNASVIGFEPNLKALEMLNESKKDCETYLPFAVADGNKHTLNFCDMYGFTSILQPDYKLLDNFNHYTKWATIYKTMEVDTKRIDDITEIENIDFLKLDIQGGELLVLENSVNKLKNCLVIQSEVSFLPMYENQPLFAEIDIFLRKQGFILHNLFSIERRYLTPLQDNKNMFAGLNQIMQADAVYIKDFSNFDNLSEEQLLKAALLLNDIYSSYDLVLKILVNHDNRFSTNYSDTYFNFINSN